MSTLDGMPLFGAFGGPCSGAAFLLSNVSKADAQLHCPDDWEVQVGAGCHYVIARHGSLNANDEDSRAAAFRAAQQGLDLLAIARAADLNIRDADTEHISWWVESGDQVLRTTHVITHDVSIGRVTVTITGPDGQPIPQPQRPPPVWHRSLRYFRLSQTTDDLFDSYRNLYLAIESILDEIAPQQVKTATTKPEGEGIWFRRALGVAHGIVALGPFAPRGSQDPVGDLFDELYKGTRTALFHSKGSRPSFLPHAGEQQRVLDVIDRMARLFMRLSEHRFGTRSNSSGLFASGFSLLTDHLTTTVSLHAADSDLCCPNLSSIDSEALVNLTTRNAPERERPFVRTWIGHVAGEELARLSRLACIVSQTSDGTPMTCGSIEGYLKIGDVARFESVVSIRSHTVQQPRGYFVT